MNKKPPVHVVIPKHVKVQRLPGIEQRYVQPAKVEGGIFSEAGPGRYPLPATWSAGVIPESWVDMLHGEVDL